MNKHDITRSNNDPLRVCLPGRPIDRLITSCKGSEWVDVRDEKARARTSNYAPKCCVNRTAKQRFNGLLWFEKRKSPYQLQFQDIYTQIRTRASRCNLSSISVTQSNNKTTRRKRERERKSKEYITFSKRCSAEEISCILRDQDVIACKNEGLKAIRPTFFSDISKD